MDKENFNPTNLNDLLTHTHLSAVNVTDPVSDEAAAFLQESYRNSVFVTGRYTVDAGNDERNHHP